MTKLLSKKAGMAPKKVEELQIKQNVLKAFTDAKNYVEEKAEEVKAKMEL